MHRTMMVVGAAVLLLVVPMTRAEAAGVAFDDTRRNVHEPSILAIAAAGITSGCEAYQYCPDGNVTRGQMATFLARALELQSVLPSGFDDVPDGHVHAGSVGAVAEAGIAAGLADGTFRPGRGVTRAQMATFLARALELDPVLPSGFSDVPDTHVHAGSVGAVAGAGIVSGFGDGRFGPDRVVSRAQMATFLTRAVGLDPVEPFISELPPQPTTADFPFNFEIAAGVPDQDRDDVLLGLALAREYVTMLAGGDMSPDAQNQLTVQVVEAGDTGSKAAEQIYMNVADDGSWGMFGPCSPDRNGPAYTACEELILASHLAITVHEYVHAWHWRMGCLTDLPLWLMEGIAQWIAHDALLLTQGPIHLPPPFDDTPIHPSYGDRETRLESHIHNARAGGALEYRLEDHAERGALSITGGIHPGYVGYVAVDHLLTSASVSRFALRSVCTELADGQPLADAFKTAFDVELAEFYAEFETWRQEQIESN